MDEFKRLDYAKLTFENNLEIDTIHHKFKSLEISEKEFFEQLEYGNIQYKIDILTKNKINWDLLERQMSFRLEEGNGECIYELGLNEIGEKLGLNEDDLSDSLKNLELLALKLDANIHLLKVYSGKCGLIAELIIRKNKFFNTCNEVKLGLFGDETSGKSTLVGVLVNGKLDNGEGSARHNIFRFQHEILCGKTSSISHQIIGFDSNGQVLTSSDWMNIIQNSSKLVSLYDLGGSEKASKTTLSALSPNYLDYFLLVLSAVQGITDTTKLFLLFADSMNLPIVSIITMIDLVNEGDIEDLIKNFKILIKSLKLKKVPLVIKSIDDISLFSRNLNENIHPIILVSNKSGGGINNLLNLLSLLPVQPNIKTFNCLNDNLCQFDIHEHFIVGSEKDIKDTNAGKLILGGIVSHGKIIVGQKYYLGPDKNGNFKIVEVADIHCKKVSVKIALKGQFSSISVLKNQKELRLEDVRKGMSLIDTNSSFPTACKSFQAEIWSIDSNTKNVKFKHEPVVTIKHVRQSCRIKKIENNHLSKNDSNNEITSDHIFLDYKNKVSDDEDDDYRKGKIQRKNIMNQDSLYYTVSPNEKILLNFEFKNYPEYITLGSHLIINDYHLKAFGIITLIKKS